jgi:hypothetical protein
VGRSAGVGETAGRRGPNGDGGGDDRRERNVNGSRFGAVGNDATGDGRQGGEVVVVVVEAGRRAEMLVGQGPVPQQEGHHGQDEHGQSPTIHRHADRQSSVTAINLQRLEAARFHGRGAGLPTVKTKDASTTWPSTERTR